MNRQVILVEGSRARCAVEMSAEPSAAEEMAGEELVHYLGKLGGVSIGLHRGEKSGAPVRILVGSRAREAADDLLVEEGRDEYYDSHPEYYAMNEHGELFERWPKAYGTHLCTSNSEGPSTWSSGRPSRRWNATRIRAS